LLFSRQNVVPQKTAFKAVLRRCDIFPLDSTHEDANDCFAAEKIASKAGFNRENERAAIHD
jgi:hypothetical protein